MRQKNRSSATTQAEGVDDFALEAAGVVYREYLFKEFEDIENDPDAEDLPDEMIQQLNHNVIKEFRRIQCREKGRRRYRRILQVAACITVIMLLLPTAVFQVDAARSGIANYLISSFPQFAEIQYDSYDNAKPPFGWSSPYYPAWLPEGSKVTKVLMESQGDFVWYEDSKNHEFQFTVLTETIQGPSFDEEDMESEKVDINGHSATLFYTKDRRIHSLVIPKLDTILIITGEISADEVMKIGESINLSLNYICLFDYLFISS